MKRTQIPPPVLPLSEAKSKPVPTCRGFIGAFCLLGVLFLLPQSASANSAPVVSNVRASQRTDGSGIVDVYYTLTDDDGDRCDISLVVSDDGGSSWSITPSSSALSPDLSNVSPGRRHIIWQSKTDLPCAYGTNFMVKVKSRRNLLQNMGFDTDLAGWTIGAVDPLGTWDVQWSEDHGGSAKMYISGSPAQTNISQETQIAIVPGDKLTVNVFHTYMGNFSNWALKIEPGDSQVLLYGTAGPEGAESITWTTDRYYDPGTLIVVTCSVWPGKSTTWVKSLIYTPGPSHAATGYGLSNIFTINNRDAITVTATNNWDGSVTVTWTERGKIRLVRQEAGNPSSETEWDRAGNSKLDEFEPSEFKTQYIYIVKDLSGTELGRSSQEVMPDVVVVLVRGYDPFGDGIDSKYWEVPEEHPEWIDRGLVPDVEAWLVDPSRRITCWNASSEIDGTASIVTNATKLKDYIDGQRTGVYSNAKDP